MDTWKPKHPLVRRVLGEKSIVTNPELDGSYIFVSDTEEECLDFVAEMTASGITMSTFGYGCYEKNRLGRIKLKEFMSNRKAHLGQSDKGGQPHASRSCSESLSVE
jgi:hypothetical protein